MNNTNVVIKGKQFDVKIVDTHEQRHKGLMGVKNLSDDQGMLFVYEKSGRYGIWMKNMLIGLDIIWFDESKKVIDYRKNAKPCKSHNCETKYPTQKSKYILEIRSGSIDNLNIKKGDEIQIN